MASAAAKVVLLALFAQAFALEDLSLLQVQVKGDVVMQEEAKEEAAEATTGISGLDMSAATEQQLPRNPPACPDLRFPYLSTYNAKVCYKTVALAVSDPTISGQGACSEWCAADDTVDDGCNGCCGDRRGHICQAPTEPCQKSQSYVAKPACHPGNVNRHCAKKRGLGVGVKWYAADGKVCHLLELFRAAKPWWYNWDTETCPLCSTSGSDYRSCEFDHDSGFVPTVASINKMHRPLSLGDALLGYYEPNHGGSDGTMITPRHAAYVWHTMEEKAKELWPEIPRIGSAAPGGEDMYLWFDEFFRFCPHCQIDFLQVHVFKSKALGRHSLQSEVEILYHKYGLNLWITEFNSGGFMENNTAIVHFDYMKEALPLLEALPYVERYAWYSMCNSIIPGAALAHCNNNTLTDLGLYYTNFVADPDYTIPAIPAEPPLE